MAAKDIFRKQIKLKNLIIHSVSNGGYSHLLWTASTIDGTAREKLGRGRKEKCVCFVVFKEKFKSEKILTKHHSILHPGVAFQPSRNTLYNIPYHFFLFSSLLLLSLSSPNPHDRVSGFLCIATGFPGICLLCRGGWP